MPFRHHQLPDPNKVTKNVEIIDADWLITSLFQCDLLEDSSSQSRHHSKICTEYGFEGWMQTSAKNDINIKEAVNMLLRKIADNIGSEVADSVSVRADNESILLHEDMPEEGKKRKGKKGGCAC